MPTPNHVKLAQKANLFKRVFDTEDGRQVLAELKKFCFLEETTVQRGGVAQNSQGAITNTGQIDPFATLYCEGKRHVLIHLLKMANLTYQDIELVRRMDELEARKDIEDEIYRN